jgi:hypothetical protein
MKIELQEWAFPVPDPRIHYALPGHERTLCGLVLDNRQRPTGAEQVCGRCWQSSRSLAGRGGV